MAKLFANAAIDMYEGYFFDVFDEDIVSASRRKIVISIPSGGTQEYLGRFNYKNGELVSGTLTGVNQFAGGALQGAVSGIKISAAKYFAFASDDDFSGLLEYAFRGNDRITGSPFDDTLLGYAGKDNINGRGGDDSIYGGSGIDILTGGLGADDFIFGSDYSGTTAKKASTITDFSSSQGDKIYLVGFDDSPVKTTSFSGVAGEFLTGAIKGGLLLQLDANGDRRADYFLKLTGGISSISESDFIVIA